MSLFLYWTVAHMMVQWLVVFVEIVNMNITEYKVRACWIKSLLHFLCSRRFYVMPPQSFDAGSISFWRAVGFASFHTVSSNMPAIYVDQVC